MASSATADQALGMGSLLNALTAETAATPALPTLVLVPRPHVFARLLAGGAVLLLAAIVAPMLFLVHAIGGLLGGITEHERILTAPVVVALPAPARLLDEGVFKASLAELPGEATRLHLARALAAAGHWPEAAASYLHARQLEVNGLPAADRVAEALAEGGARRRGLPGLIGLDYSAAAMEPAVRAQAVALLGRCHLAARAARLVAGETSGARLP